MCLNIKLHWYSQQMWFLTVKSKFQKPVTQCLMPKPKNQIFQNDFFLKSPKIQKYSAPTDVSQKKIVSNWLLGRLIHPDVLLTFWVHPEFVRTHWHIGTSLLDQTDFNGGLVGMVGLSKVCLFERPRFFVTPLYIYI